MCLGRTAGQACSAHKGTWHGGGVARFVHIRGVPMFSHTCRGSCEWHCLGHGHALPGKLTSMSTCLVGRKATLGQVREQRKCPGAALRQEDLVACPT
jgi:hypothetical protein